jgi:Uma2 family endonuclease
MIQPPSQSKLSDPPELEPTWDIARLFPPQGQWTADAYLALDTNRIVELSNGKLEVLEMPSELHQILAARLYVELQMFVCRHSLGLCLFAPLRIRICDRTFREPDVVFLLNANRGKRHAQYWDGADLAIEVVSPDDPQRDLVDKRHDYEAIGVAECWIVDPCDQTITVLVLDSVSQQYVEHARATLVDCVESMLLPGFVINVSQLFAAA